MTLTLLPPDAYPIEGRTPVTKAVTTSSEGRRIAAAVPSPDAIELPGGDAIVSQEPGQRTQIDTIGANPFKRMGGSERPAFNSVLFRDVLETLHIPDTKNDGASKRVAAASAALAAFKPTDEIEGMIAAQAVALHATMMESSRRAMLADQPFEMAQGFRKAASNASRAFTGLLEALDRKRGKVGQQRVVVEHVHIYPGAQANVGSITSSAIEAGDQEKSHPEPRAAPARLAHDTALGAVVPAVWGAVPEPARMHATGDAERPLPPPRRKVDGSQDG